MCIDDSVNSDLWKELRAVLRKKPELQAELKSQKTHVLKDKWRKEWYALRAQEVKQEIKQITSLIIDDTREGELMTLGRIAWETDPANPDYEAAINWGKSCIQIGRSEFEINVGGHLWR